MGSRERRAELEAELASLDDDDDENDEVEIGLGDGRYFRGSYRRAKQLGHVTEPAPKQDPPAKDKQGGEVKRFSGRRVS